jgi:hypothetical protein
MSGSRVTFVPPEFRFVLVALVKEGDGGELVFSLAMARLAMRKAAHPH